MNDKRPTDNDKNNETFLTNNDKIQEILQRFENSNQENVSAADLPTVLLLGETGSGKTIIAEAIHKRSNLESPFNTVNCAGIPEALLESELFGHVIGAFTGANRKREGKVLICAGGTLFLDEIAETSPAFQAKLLRLLSEKKYSPLGSDHEIDANIRIIAATNKDLSEEVRNGKFRMDLFYRLNVVPLRIPPLRERKEDIKLLAENFLKMRSSERHKLDKKAVKALESYNWPGNVRELKNVIENAFFRCVTDKNVIGEKAIKLAIQDMNLGISASMHREQTINEELYQDLGISSQLQQALASELAAEIIKFENSKFIEPTDILDQIETFLVRYAFHEKNCLQSDKKRSKTLPCLFDKSRTKLSNYLKFPRNS